MKAGCSSTPRTAAPSSTASRRRAFGRARLGTCALLFPFPAGPPGTASRSTSGSASPRLFSARPHRLAATAGDGAAGAATPRAPSTAQARVAAVRARAAARRRAPRARTGGGVVEGAAPAAVLAGSASLAGTAATLEGGGGGGRRPLAMAPARRAGGVGGAVRRAFDLTMLAGRDGKTGKLGGRQRTPDAYGRKYCKKNDAGRWTA